MTIRTKFGLAIATLCVASVSEAAAPVHTSRTRFRIPYKYDAPEMQRLGAKEIRLYVSSDRGARWQQALTVAPEAGKFDYEAPGEGEFWFAVRTLDGTNRLHPQGQIIDPELKVIVDQTAPTLDIQIRQTENGKVQLSWRAEDENLNARELRLEYQQPGEANWQMIGLIPQSSGQFAWNVGQAGVVAVRGTVTDFAGNLGRGQNQLRVDAGVSLPGRPGVPDLRQPVAEGPDAVDGFEKGEEFGSTNDQNLPNVSSNRPMPRSSRSTLPRETAERNSLVTDDNAARPDLLQGRYPMDGVGPGQELPVAGSKARFVNSRKFNIGYKLEDVGPSGVSAVELFITEDNGKKWFKYGVDPDNQSPFEVEVPRDGSFGFAIRVRSGAGLAGDPPQPGEVPSIVVNCDQIAPQVQMFAPQQGRGDSLNKVLIRWKATDDNLAEKSIQISYAVDAAGPWQTIADWQANTGSYVWAVSPSVPARIYIRVSARDSAGNVSKADTPDPVVVDLTKPSARIVDVESSELSVFPR